MSTFTLSFLATFAGVIVVALIARRTDSKFRAPVPARNSGGPLEYPRAMQLLFACRLVLVCWALLAAFMIGIALSFTGWRVINVAVPVVLGLFMTVAISYITIASFLRCPNCERHVIVQWVTHPPFEEKLYGLIGWAAVVVGVLMYRRFRCMYCGQDFHVTSTRKGLTRRCR